MNKKEKKLEKALKLAGIDKEKWDDVVDLLSDEEDTIETQKEEVEEKEEENPKEDTLKDGDTPKEESKPKEEPKIDKENKENEILKEALAQLKTQAEEIENLKTVISKNDSFGYSPKPKQGVKESSAEDTAKKMENIR